MNTTGSAKILSSSAFKCIYIVSDAPAAKLDDNIGNVLGMKDWGAKQDLITLRMEPNRDIWLMHPAIVNAWYSPNHNTISKHYNNNF